MTVVGELALWIAFFLAAWAGVATFAGHALRHVEFADSGKRGIFAAAVMTALACVGLWAALLRHDFALEYVAANTTINTPTLYLLTAFWAGTGGRVLWLALALAICASITVASSRRKPGAASASWVGATVATLLAVALGSACIIWNPFVRVEWIPAEGRGLAPALQNPWAAPHFVTLFPAYAAATVAVAVAVTEGRAHGGNETRIAALRGWLLAAWCLITAAIACRMRWAYVEPALGGGWTWDVGQSANMVLWVVATALVRSLLVRSPQATGSRRVVSMYVVYVGAALLVIGLAARQYWTERSIRVRPGQSAEARDPYRGRWRFVSQGPSRDERVNYLSTSVAVEAWRGDASVGIVAAERRQYLDSSQRPVGEPAMRPGIRSFLALDLYLLLAEVRGELAEFRVSFRPLVSCVWIGWVLLLAGAIGVVTQLTMRHASRPSGPALPAA